MAEHGQHGLQQLRHPVESVKGMLPDRGPSTAQVLSVAVLLPAGGTLLALSGLTLILTLVGLAVATPVFVVFSPVLVPAAVVIGLAVAGFLASGAFGLTAVTSLSWIVNYLRGAGERVPEQMDQLKRRMAETAGQAGQRTKEIGERIQSKAQHEARTT
ncbi:putative oleosin 18 kDa [Iris pallida]|uniref:Oleosin 18 kDa n=1 Tax=Iris pallida TaxID=29817 RepID=A0AAX6F4I1_IRIPA|nr:putative oleosin 18 kDa [Iris pallida]